MTQLRTVRTRPRRLRATLVVFLVGFGALGLTACSKPEAGAAARGKLVPQKGALFGAYVDPAGRWIDNDFAKRQVSSREAQLGRTLAIEHHFYAWTDVFPSGLEEWALAKGSIPLISWAGTNLSAVLSGHYDEMIRTRARQVAGLKKPVFLRWAWEMNGDWSDWDGLRNNDPGSTNGPAKYRASWRRIHDIFQKAGASNAVWVWAPNGDDVPTDAWNHWTNYYPGDKYVDWVGIDGYNWGTSQPWSWWNPFNAIFARVYQDYAPKKPIMIAETASTEIGGNKAAWITAARSAIKTEFPAVAAFVYFDKGGDVDWRVDSSDAAFRAYKAMALDPYFNGAAPGG